MFLLTWLLYPRFIDILGLHESIANVVCILGLIYAIGTSAGGFTGRVKALLYTVLLSLMFTQFSYVVFSVSPEGRKIHMVLALVLVVLIFGMYRYNKFVAKRNTKLRKELNSAQRGQLGPFPFPVKGKTQ